jgi:hypothetical protein
VPNGLIGCGGGLAAIKVLRDLAFNVRAPCVALRQKMAR